MRIIAFVERPQGEVFEKILQDCGGWQPSAPRGAPARDDRVYHPEGEWDIRSASYGHPPEFTYVDMYTFGASFRSSTTPHRPWAARTFDGIDP